jgi:hypothetical protein
MRIPNAVSLIIYQILTMRSLRKLFDDSLDFGLIFDLEMQTWELLDGITAFFDSEIGEVEGPTSHFGRKARCARRQLVFSRDSILLLDIFCDFSFELIAREALRAPKGWLSIRSYSISDLLDRILHGLASLWGTKTGQLTREALIATRPEAKLVQIHTAFARSVLFITFLYDDVSLNQQGARRGKTCLRWWVLCVVVVLYLRCQRVVVCAVCQH